MRKNTVKTLVTFNEPRTPCPPVGTIGRIVGTSGPHKVVRFSLPMKIDGGGEMQACDNYNSIDLYFLPKELEVLTSTTT